MTKCIPCRANICGWVFVLAVLAVLPCFASASSAAEGDKGELLYNGIRLPAAWPPRSERRDHEPMPLPYLEAPPEVISIDVGRQLFVDNFPITAKSGWIFVMLPPFRPF